MLEVFIQYPIFLIACTIVFGLTVGSFLNVVIYRLPVMMEREWKQECRLILELNHDDQLQASTTGRFNLAVPNSHCPHCNAPIKAWQNIPVLSYLFLRGRCAQCNTKISPRYPIIEAVTGLLSGIIAWHLGPSAEAFFALLLTFSLISLTMIDADHKLLPDQITLPLLWTGLLVNCFELYTPLQDAVWGAIAGYLSLWSVYWVFKLLTKKEGMGYGDFKLLAALGAWMGWQALPVIIILSSLVGAIIGSIMLIASKRGRNTAIPFGPYLAVAGWITFLWGEQITQAYFHFSGI